MKEQNVFENFEAAFQKQNRTLKISLVVIVLFLTTCLFGINTNRILFMRANADYLSRELPMKDVCWFSIKTIAERKLSTSFISKQVQQFFLDNKRYTINAEKIFDPFILSENKCKVVTSDKSKLRAFVLTMEKNTSNPYIYKTVDINEVVVDEKEIK